MKTRPRPARDRLGVRHDARRVPPPRRDASRNPCGSREIAHFPFAVRLAMLRAMKRADFASPSRRSSIAFALFVMPRAHAAGRRRPTTAPSTTATRPTGRTIPTTAGDVELLVASCRDVIRNQVDAVDQDARHRHAPRPRVGQDHGDPRVLIAVTDSGIEWNERRPGQQVVLQPRRAAAARSGCPGSDGTTLRRQRRRQASTCRTTRPTTGHKLRRRSPKVCDPRITRTRTPTASSTPRT